MQWQPWSRGSLSCSACSDSKARGELYREKDLGLWPARTKPEFPFHSQPLSPSHICEGTDTTLGKKAFFKDAGGELPGEGRHQPEPF